MEIDGLLRLMYRLGIELHGAAQFISIGDLERAYSLGYWDALEQKAESDRRRRENDGKRG